MNIVSLSEYKQGENDGRMNSQKKRMEGVSSLSLLQSTLS